MYVFVVNKAIDARLDTVIF